MKENIPKKLRNFEKIKEPLLVEVWMHKNKDHLWESFLEALKTVRYVNEPWSNIAADTDGYDGYDDVHDDDDED